MGEDERHVYFKSVVEDEEDWLCPCCGEDTLVSGPGSLCIFCRQEDENEEG